MNSLLLLGLSITILALLPTSSYALRNIDADANIEIDGCRPSFKKSSAIFATPEEHFDQITKTCKIYVTKKITNHVNFTPPEAHYSQLINITVMDVIHLLREFSCYIFEIGMILMSMVLLCCSVIYMIILLLFKYGYMQL